MSIPGIFSATEVLAWSEAVLKTLVCDNSYHLVASTPYFIWLKTPQAAI